MKIALCSSASFYKHLNEVGDKLEVLGHEVVRPKFSGENDEQLTKDDSKEYYKWHKDLIDTHFKEIEKSDAILVINAKKHKINGYIGTNVMMEIAIAYYLKKKVFILNKISPGNPVYDEIHAIKATILDGDISKIS